MTGHEIESEIAVKPMVKCISSFHKDFIQKLLKGYIIRHIGHCIGGNFSVHIWAWLASPSIQVGRLYSSREIIEKSNSVSLECCHIYTIRDQLPVFCPTQ